MDARVDRGPTRREMLYIATGTFGALGAAAAIWPFLSQMSPDASTQALGAVEIDLASLPVGGIITVKWRGKPSLSVIALLARSKRPRMLEWQTYSTRTLIAPECSVPSGW